MLKSRGVVILPVYVGNRASVSQLSHIAETQFTGISWVVLDTDRWLVGPHESFLGAIAQALGHIGGYQDGNAGLMLSGYAPAGAPGQSSASRRSAIVMFARVMAQCPGACVAKCMLDKPYNKVNYRPFHLSPF